VKSGFAYDHHALPFATASDAFATASDAYLAGCRPDLHLITKFNSMGGLNMTDCVIALKDAICRRTETAIHCSSVGMDLRSSRSRYCVFVVSIGHWYREASDAMEIQIE
jgi:hypothetical protein